MGEGTKTIDYMEELRKLKEQFERQWNSPNRGCVCPPGSEATCKGALCPRQPVQFTCSVKEDARSPYYAGPGWPALRR